MKRIITILFVFCMSLIYAEKSYSQNKTRIDVTEKLSIEIPDNYIRKECKSCLIDAENKNNGNIILIKTLEVSDFNPGYVRKSMDTLCFNISDAKLIKKEKEKFYRMDEDYVKKYYELGNDKFITYTFYTNKYPYCILFTYNNENELKTIDDIIESIEMKMNFFGEFYYMCMTSTFMVLFLFGVGVFIVTAIQDSCNPIRNAVIFYLVTFALSFILLPSYGLLSKLIFPLILFEMCKVFVEKHAK
ncbi:MAG: hypothetical protein J6R32_09845 [Bacteroidales bacterium]|nr:hypothetical protein [Bacteroidales bacterium]